MKQDENGQDTKLIMGNREYPVENVEDNLGQATLSEADNNMQLESVLGVADVEHEMTVAIDGSNRQADGYLYDNNYHPKTGRTVHLVGGEYGSRGRKGIATERPRTVPSKDGTSIEFTIRFETAERTNS